MARRFSASPPPRRVPLDRRGTVEHEFAFKVIGDKIASTKSADGQSTGTGTPYYFCCVGCKPRFDGTKCKFGYDPTYLLSLKQRSRANSFNISNLYHPLGNRLQKFDSGAMTASQYNGCAGYSDRR